VVSDHEGENGSRTFFTPLVVKRPGLTDRNDLVRYGMVLKNRYRGSGPVAEVVLGEHGGDVRASVELLDRLAALGQLAESGERGS
jgi:hypothetical protein